MREFIKEVKRRNVFKVAIVYLIAGWVTMQIVDVMFPALRLPDWMTRAVAALLLLGFPFALIFAWAFEMTPEGIKREKDVDRSESITGETGQRLNQVALVALAVAVGFLLFDKFYLSPDRANRNVEEETSASISAVAAKPSIAVLPFVNMSDDASNEYFSDGLSEELLNLLAKIPELHVAGRTSSFKFKGTNEDLRIIGDQLNVKHILEGSVRKSGDRLRITAQLIDTENGYHLWSENYDKNLTDIFAIQDEIAAAVVGELKVTLLGNSTLPQAGGTSNIQAYNALLKCNYYIDRTSEENLKLARAACNEAIELDPRYAEAYLALAIIEQQDASGWASNSGHEGNFIAQFERVRELADRAMALDDTNADAYVVQAVVLHIIDWDIAGAIELVNKAVSMQPSNINAAGWLSSMYLFDGDIENAERWAKHGIDIDPLNIANLRVLGDIYALSDRIDEAILVYERALSLAPDSGRLHGRLGRAYMYRGDFDTARKHIEQEPVDWVREQLNVILVRHDQGKEAWQAAVDHYIDSNGIGNSYQYAEIFAEAGDLDNGFYWLQECARIKDPGGPWALTVPWFEKAKNDPRWADFEAQFKL